MISITDNSNRAWTDKHPLKLERYLRRNHLREDRSVVFNLLYHSYPNEGRKLIENCALSFAIITRFAYIFKPIFTMFIAT